MPMRDRKHGNIRSIELFFPGEGDSIFADNLIGMCKWITDLNTCPKLFQLPDEIDDLGITGIRHIRLVGNTENDNFRRHGHAKLYAFLDDLACNKRRHCSLVPRPARIT